MKASLLAFGALILAAPVVAQPSSDPLAPLPEQPKSTQPQPAILTAPPAATQPAPPPVPAVAVPKDWRSVLLLVVSLVPGAVALLPLTMGPAWYLSADENQPYLTDARVIWMLTVFAIALAPFLGAPAVAANQP